VIQGAVEFSALDNIVMDVIGRDAANLQEIQFINISRES